MAIVNFLKVTSFNIADRIHLIEVQAVADILLIHGDAGDAVNLDDGAMVRRTNERMPAVGYMNPAQMIRHFEDNDD